MVKREPSPPSRLVCLVSGHAIWNCCSRLGTTRKRSREFQRGQSNALTPLIRPLNRPGDAHFQTSFYIGIKMSIFIFSQEFILLLVIKSITTKTLLLKNEIWLLNPSKVLASNLSSTVKCFLRTDFALYWALCGCTKMSQI